MEFALIARTTTKLEDLVDVLYIGLTIVAVVADEESFPRVFGDQSSEQQQLHAKQVEGLAQQLLALFVEDDGLEGVLDEVPCVDVLDELLEISVILMDGLEHEEESFNDVNITLSEVLIQLDQIHIRLHLIFKFLSILQVLKIEDDFAIHPGFVRIAAFFSVDQWNVIGHSLQLSNNRLGLRTQLQQTLPTVIVVIKEINLALPSVLSC